MLSIASLLADLPQISSTWNWLYVLALVAFALLTMSLLAAHSSNTRKSRRSASIAGTITSFLSRKIPLSSTISHHQPASSLPLLAPLLTRQITHPGLDEKHTAQLTSITMQDALSSHIHSLASTYPRCTYLGYSTFETPSAPALYGMHKHLTDTVYLGNICHVDPITGSVTTRLHADDISAVVEAGWGQRAPSTDEVLLYTPRDEHDLEVQKTIIQAAIGYVCKSELEDGKDTPLEDPSSLIRPQWLLPQYGL